jgi:non-lysosomal glucosylceramidase
MIFRGMVREGVEVFENARRRYDGERRNPWDEPECGHHYARAMAAWAGVLALSGFQYHGAQKSLAARPRINPQEFSSFWSTGKAWGTFSQNLRAQKLEFALEVSEGELPLKTLTLAAGNGKRQPASTARLGARKLAHRLERKGSEASMEFADELILKRRDRLEVVI